jgi:hypothetical protein
MRLVFGILIGAALTAGGGWLWLEHSHDCARRCGDGTRCFNGRCIAQGPATAVAPPKDTRRKKRRSSDAAPELKLAPGDERIVASGDALGRPEHIDLSQPGDDGRELSQDELDSVFRPAQSRITRCMTEAVGDYPLESGKVEVSFRIERSGAVRKVRLTAPQLLMRRGLPTCVREAVTSLHFPASGGANVVTYPFQLQ